MTPKQQIFLDHYMRDPDRNGTRAAIAAGYSQKRAPVTASEILALPEIRAEIDKVIAKASKRTQLTVERVQEEIGRVALANVKNLYDEAGNLKPIHELTDDEAAAISGLEVEDVFEGSGKDREKVGTLRKVKTWDKVAALNLAAKHLGMVRESAAFAVGQLNIIIQD